MLPGPRLFIQKEVMLIELVYCLSNSTSHFLYPKMQILLPEFLSAQEFQRRRIESFEAGSTRVCGSFGGVQ